MRVAAVPDHENHHMPTGTPVMRSAQTTKTAMMKRSPVLTAPLP